MIKPYSPKLTKNQHFIPQMYLKNFSFIFNNKKEEAEIYFLMICFPFFILLVKKIL